MLYRRLPSSRLCVPAVSPRPPGCLPNHLGSGGAGVPGRRFNSKSCTLHTRLTDISVGALEETLESLGDAPRSPEERVALDSAELAALELGRVAVIAPGLRPGAFPCSFVLLQFPARSGIALMHACQI